MAKRTEEEKKKIKELWYIKNRERLLDYKRKKYKEYYRKNRHEILENKKYEYFQKKSILQYERIVASNHAWRFDI